MAPITVVLLSVWGDMKCCMKFYNLGVIIVWSLLSKACWSCDAVYASESWLSCQNCPESGSRLSCLIKLIFSTNIWDLLHIRHSIRRLEFDSFETLSVKPDQFENNFDQICTSLINNDNFWTAYCNISINHHQQILNWLKQTMKSF